MKLPYGIQEAGRQWAKVFEEWLTKNSGLERVPGVRQLFVKRRKDGEITLMISKITDDALVAGTPTNLKEFSAMLSQKYELSKVVLDEQMNFNVCNITKEENGGVTIDMIEYMSRVSPKTLDEGRSKKPQAKATQTEIERYRAIAGELVWVGYTTSSSSCSIIHATESPDFDCPRSTRR